MDSKFDHEFEGDLSLSDIQGFLTKRPGGIQFLEALKKNRDFAIAIKHPLGKILLKDALEEAELRYRRILQQEGESTWVRRIFVKDNDKAEFRAYNQIITRWSTKVARYIEGINAVKGKK